MCTVRRLTEDKSWSAEAVADMEWTPWKTAATTRGRPPKAAAGERNEPIWNAPLPAMPNAIREPPTRSVDSKARSETVGDAMSTPGKSDVQERPDDARGCKNHEGNRCLTQEAHPPDPCETTPARPTRTRSPNPPIGESPATPPPKRLRSVNVDDSGMVAAQAGVTELCEEPQPDWEAVASSENVGSTWFMRRHGARMVHLGHLREHRVYKELDLPQGVKPLSIRWVDKDDYHTAKARLTARAYEQELT